MATPVEEQARRDALDARRKAGDAAWSPSRAREALRAYLCESGLAGVAHTWSAEAERAGAFDEPEALRTFARRRVPAFEYQFFK
jgi:hypothetical protein